VRGAVVRRQSVDSSSIESVGYDAKDQTLELEYVNGGVYKYFGVPEFVHRRLLTSDSPGAFVNSVIKRNYEFREVR
jgi:KTSC domain